MGRGGGGAGGEEGVTGDGEAVRQGIRYSAVWPALATSPMKTCLVDTREVKEI